MQVQNRKKIEKNQKKSPFFRFFLIFFGESVEKKGESIAILSVKVRNDITDTWWCALFYNACGAGERQHKALSFPRAPYLCTGAAQRWGAMVIQF